ncbi:MAG: hypothetical protein KC912_07665 [Proteobacteria bacterium]|nr:hypothetical protein [Pseudomonadota bacterium]
MRPLWATLTLATLAACSQNNHPDGFVIMDSAAREAGHAVELAGVDQTRILPTIIPQGTEATIYLGPDVHSVALGPGEVLRITADDLVFGYLDEDYNSDLLYVEADADAREELAYQAGVDALSGGLLESEDLFLLLSDLDAPDGVLEVQAVPIDAPERAVEPLGPLHTSGVGQSSTSTVRHAITLTFGGGNQADGASSEVPNKAKATGAVAHSLYANPVHVGVYTYGDACIILDAAGDASYCGADGKRIWTSKGDTVVLHDFTGPTRLTFSDDVSTLAFPDGRQFRRLR